MFLSFISYLSRSIWALIFSKLHSQDDSTFLYPYESLCHLNWSLNCINVWFVCVTWHFKSQHFYIVVCWWYISYIQLPFQIIRDSAPQRSMSWINNIIGHHKSTLSNSYSDYTSWPLEKAPRKEWADCRSFGNICITQAKKKNRTQFGYHWRCMPIIVSSSFKKLSTAISYLVQYLVLHIILNSLYIQSRCKVQYIWRIISIRKNIQIREIL